MGLFSGSAKTTSVPSGFLPPDTTPKKHGLGGFLSAAQPFLALAAYSSDPSNPLASYALQSAILKRQQNAQDKKEQAAAAQIYQALKQEGLPDRVITGLMLDKNKIADFFAQKYGTKQFGFEGGSVGSIDPNSGQLNTQRAPGWIDGSYYAGGAGNEKPQMLQEGLKFVPTPPGGMTQVFHGVIGSPVTRGEVFGNQQPGNLDSTPTIEEGHQYTPGPGGRANPANWKFLGGATAGPSPTFP